MFVLEILVGSEFVIFLGEIDFCGIWWKNCVSGVLFRGYDDVMNIDYENIFLMNREMDFVWFSLKWY